MSVIPCQPREKVNAVSQFKRQNQLINQDSNSISSFSSELTKKKKDKFY